MQFLFFLFRFPDTIPILLYIIVLDFFIIFIFLKITGNRLPEQLFELDGTCDACDFLFHLHIFYGTIFHCTRGNVKKC